MTVFGFVVVVFVARTLAVKQMTWLRAGNDVKFVSSGTVLDVRTLKRIQCGVACCIVENCFAFNYHGPNSECELLSATPTSLAVPEMVASPDWSFYVVNVPTGDPCSASGCPVTAMCLLYDQPVQLTPYDPSLPEFTCSNHAYYLRRRKDGLTDCRLNVIYGLDLAGFDTAYFGVSAPYHEGLQNCLSYSCVSMACQGLNRCFLKTSSFEDNPDAADYVAWKHFWNPSCQEG